MNLRALLMLIAALLQGWLPLAQAAQAPMQAPAPLAATQDMHCEHCPSSTHRQSPPLLPACCEHGHCSCGGSCSATLTRAVDGLTAIHYLRLPQAPPAAARLPARLHSPLLRPPIHT